MRQAEQDGEHIWLRQSVTFTVAGQTRTVEIAIPLRPGASAEDVEALLGEADAGMERLSRRLDERVAALLNGSPSVSPAAPPPPESAEPAETTSASPAQPSRPTPPTASATTADVPEAAPLTERPSAPPASASGTRSSAPPAAAASRATPPPARSEPQAAAARPAPATTARGAAPAPGRASASGPLGAAQAPSGPDLTRPEFIAAALELGLNVKQAMERLGVRSLEGLNLREALEVLRRQAVRGEAPGESTPSGRSAAVRPSTPSTPSTPPAREPTPAAPEPRYFDEEDDLDVTFTVDEDEEIEEEFGVYTAGGPGDSIAPDPLDEIDDLDLDDVPDFGPPPSAARSPSSATRRSSAPSHPAPASAASPTVPDVPAASDQRARALQLVGQMRAARGGGVASSQQRTAYRNIVARELGEPEASALVRGLWRTTPDRLSAEQLDALISWGKQDTFSDEAAVVLAELRAERARAAAEQPPSGSESPRPAPRGRTAGTGRGAPGAS